MKLDPTERSAERDLLAFRVDAGRIESEIAKAVIGQVGVVREVLTAILAGGHVLLEGVPGVGKTLLVRSFSRVLGLEFKRVQCTPDMIPADVTGTNVLLGDDRGTRGIQFQQGPIFTSLLLADEINRATPKTQSAFLEAMEEHQVTVAGQTHPLPEPFFVLATQNPIEIEGTFPLPEAQLDRFMLKILVDYPERDELRRIARETTGEAREQLERIVSGERILDMQRLVRRIPIATDMLDVAVTLVRATHPAGPEATEQVQRFVRFGASPRAVQTIVLAAKVNAILLGRCHVSGEDLAAVARPALRHRILLGFEASTSAVTEDEIIAGILETHLP